MNKLNYLTLIVVLNNIYMSNKYEEIITGYIHKLSIDLNIPYERLLLIYYNQNYDLTIDSSTGKYMYMSNQDYMNTISEIKSVAESISLKKADFDGRIDSAIKEPLFLSDMKRILLDKHPDWEIIISPPRASFDIMINSIRINLKLTDCKSADNSLNKPSIYYSITGLTTYPYSSNWNEFLDKIIEANNANLIKKQRHKPTEYHYLVKNKVTGHVLLKPIFDIYTYVSNASNDLQINWKNEFIYSEYYTQDDVYIKKVQSLLLCIQKSIKEMIERSKRFAEADIETLIK